MAQNDDSIYQNVAAERYVDDSYVVYVFSMNLIERVNYQTKRYDA